MNKLPTNNSMRVIKTARTEEAINEAAINGYKPLVKLVQPSSEIRSKFSVVQNQTTGEIQEIGDYRMSDMLGSQWKEVIGWTEYYPHNFPAPYAAYLLPQDIQVGERVILDDLIEDYVGMSWNQGDVFRLESCEAVWNGVDLIIQYEPEINRRSIIG